MRLYVRRECDEWKKALRYECSTVEVLVDARDATAANEEDGTLLYAETADGTPYEDPLLVLAGEARPIVFPKKDRLYLGSALVRSWARDPIASWQEAGTPARLASVFYPNFSAGMTELFYLMSAAIEVEGLGSPLHRLGVRVACDVVEPLLPYWRERYPKDERLTEYFEAVRGWCRGQTTFSALEEIQPRAASCAEQATGAPSPAGLAQQTDAALFVAWAVLYLIEVVLRHHRLVTVQNYVTEVSRRVGRGASLEVTPTCNATVRKHVRLTQILLPLVRGGRDEARAE